MRKIYALLVTVISLAANAQEPGTISIGNDNLVYPSMPVFSFYGYSYSQQIVPKATFNAAGGTAGEITKLRYFCSSTGSSITPWNTWTIYIGHTDMASFEGSDWVEASGLTAVFSGEFMPEAGQWIEFTFSQPFEYNDIDNIVIAVDENAPGWTAAGDAAQLHSYAETGNCGMIAISDSTNIDPFAPIASSSTFWQVPMLQLEGQALGVTDHARTTVSVYPNPSNGVFNMTSDSEIKTVEVYDLSARLVHRQNLSNGNTIDLSRLEATSYLLRIFTEEGISTTRIVKK